MKRINRRKMWDELKALTLVVYGLVLLICNFFKITPGVETALAYAITTVIAYGFILGLFSILVGLCWFIEIRDTKYTRKGAHK